MLVALATSASLAGIAVLISGWPWRSPRPPAVATGWIVGQGTGLVVGCSLLGLRPHWPPKEDLDRFFIIVVPMIAVVELAAPWLKVPRWLVSSMRIATAASIAPILLHGSSYVAGSTAWSPVQSWLILGGLALALGSVWWLLASLARRAMGLSVAVSLAVTCAGAAIIVMLSGYATGGQVAIPLAGSIAGTSVATLLLAHSSRATEPIGIAVVGLFSVLVMGRFFGDLTTTHAALLFFAPVLGWVPEVPLMRRLRPWVRGLAHVALVILTVAAVGAGTLHQFIDQSQSAFDSSPSEPAAQDDFDYGR
jgi:hypothetical protein